MTEKKLTPADRANEVANNLIGTCGNLGDHATAEEINNHKFCEELDAHVFQCECCGWWCGIEEMTKDEFCQDCSSEDNGE